MWRVRPAKLDDLQQILDIAGAQTARLSSTLPKTEETLARKIQHSRAPWPTTPPPKALRAAFCSYSKTPTPAKSPAPQVSTAAPATATRFTITGVTTSSTPPTNSTSRAASKSCTRATP